VIRRQEEVENSQWILELSAVLISRLGRAEKRGQVVCRWPVAPYASVLGAWSVAALEVGGLKHEAPSTKPTTTTNASQRPGRHQLGPSRVLWQLHFHHTDLQLVIRSRRPARRAAGKLGPDYGRVGEESPRLPLPPTALRCPLCPLLVRFPSHLEIPLPRWWRAENELSWLPMAR